MFLGKVEYHFLLIFFVAFLKCCFIFITLSSSEVVIHFKLGCCFIDFNSHFYSANSPLESSFLYKIGCLMETLNYLIFDAVICISFQYQIVGTFQRFYIILSFSFETNPKLQEHSHTLITNSFTCHQTIKYNPNFSLNYLMKKLIYKLKAINKS